MKVVAVTGSTALYGLDDASKLFEALNAEAPNLVVVGDCPTGADSVARAWSQHYGVECIVFDAHWNVLWKRAGVVRNEVMMRFAAHCRNIGHFVRVIAMPRGAAPGTRNAIGWAKEFGLEVEEL